MLNHPEVRIDYATAGSGSSPFPALSVVKSHLRVDFDDDDTYIESIRSAAKSYIEEYCSLKFGTFVNYAYWDYAHPLVLVPAQANAILDTYPDTLQLDVLQDDGTYAEVAAAEHDIDFKTNPIRVRYSGTYSYTRKLNRFRLRFQTQNSTVPAYVSQAFLMICGHFYENRQDVGKDRVFEVPMNSRYLLERFRQSQF